MSSTRQGATLNNDNPPFPTGAKYPFTSITSSVSLVENIETSPFVPAGTIAALATAALDGAFSVEASGCVCPAGHAVRKPMPVLCTAVTFNEYACAVPATLHGLASKGNVRALLPTNAGPPSGPAGSRVSTRRHGVMG